MSDYWAGECVVNERLAKHRAAVLRPILELEKRGEPISTAIGDAAWELGLAKSHTWSLYRRLRENDARATALELDRRGPKRGSKRIAQDVEIIIDESLRKYYLVRERSSFLRIWREIRAECEAKGFQRPILEENKFFLPSSSSLPPFHISFL